VLKREKVLSPERLVRMVSQVAIGLDGPTDAGSFTATSSRTTSFSAGRERATCRSFWTSASAKDTAGTARSSRSSADDRQPLLHGSRAGPGARVPRRASGRLCARRGHLRVHHRPGAIRGQQRAVDPSRNSHEGPRASHGQRLGRKYPVPPGWTTFSKSRSPRTRPSARPRLAPSLTPSGHAYGLTGDHKQWAATPLQQLGTQIGAAMPGLLAPKWCWRVERSISLRNLPSAALSWRSCRLSGEESTRPSRPRARRTFRRPAFREASLRGSCRWSLGCSRSWSVERSRCSS